MINEMIYLIILIILVLLVCVWLRSRSEARSGGRSGAKSGERSEAKSEARFGGRSRKRFGGRSRKRSREKFENPIYSQIDYIKCEPNMASNLVTEYHCSNNKTSSFKIEDGKMLYTWFCRPLTLRGITFRCYPSGTDGDVRIASLIVDQETRKATFILLDVTLDYFHSGSEILSYVENIHLEQYHPED